MYQNLREKSAFTRVRAKQQISLSCKILVFTVCFLQAAASYGQQPNKIQQTIEAIKATYDNSRDNYVTDGQRTVWVNLTSNGRRAI